MDLSYMDDISSGVYSRSQSLECGACALEAECRECEESLYLQRAESCQECVEYALTRGEGEYKENKVSCFTACAPKTKTKTKQQGKKARRESRKREEKEAGREDSAILEEASA